MVAKPKDILICPFCGFPAWALCLWEGSLECEDGLISYTPMGYLRTRGRPVVLEKRTVTYPHYRAKEDEKPQVRSCLV